MKRRRPAAQSVDMSSKPKLKLDWCSHKAAKYAVEKWHYSKRMPVNKTVKIGVWEDGKYIGAVIFSCGSAGTASYGKRFGLRQTQTVELARVALSEHKTEVSRIISIAMKMLRRQSPDLRLVVSYADENQNHIGSIYQAGNWIYVGQSAKDTAYIDTNGKVWHSRSVSKDGTKVHCGVRTSCPKIDDLEPVAIKQKWKYLYPLCQETSDKIEPLRKPYPKRATSIGTDAPATHAGEGGANPTVALQTLRETG